MNTTMILQLTRQPTIYFRLLFNVQRILQNYVPNTACTTTIDNIDAFTSQLLRRHKTKVQTTRHIFATSAFSFRYSMKNEHNNLPPMTKKISTEELENIIDDLLLQNKEQEIAEVISKCEYQKKLISENVLKKLLKVYSVLGKPVMVQTLIDYCEKLDKQMFLRNGEFLHYSAKAQCMKGNSEKGLEILKDCYERYISLRGLYRIIFKELIQDSVSHRSEASMVIFKKNIIEFSDRWNDHYPLICMWHICWLSTWFSDQMLANELFDTSIVLRNIVKDKAMAFSVSTLRSDFNEDPVVRLLQLLLKHKLMDEYVKVLQVLFNYKLQNRDVRGCTEIIKNCDVLGVTLPSVQQGKYIRMLIDGKPTPIKPSKNFKLKF